MTPALEHPDLIGEGLGVEHLGIAGCEDPVPEQGHLLPDRGAFVVVIRYSHAYFPLSPFIMLDSSGWNLRMRYSDMATGVLISSSRSTVASYPSLTHVSSSSRVAPKPALRIRWASS